MGLKYNYFLCKETSGNLKSKLLSASRFSPKDDQSVLEAELMLDKKIKTLLDKKDINQLLSIEKPEIITEYEKRQKYVVFFSIWGKQLPDTDYIFGGYTTNTLFPRRYDIVLAYITDMQYIC